MTRINFYLIIAIGIFLIPNSSDAQLGFFSDDHQRKIGARSVGMGGAVTALTNDATAVYWNPGALGLLQGISIVSGASVYQNWGSFKEEDDVRFFSSGRITPNPIKLNFNNVTFAAPINLDGYTRITPVLSYHEYTNYKGIKETWTIELADGRTTAEDVFEFDNTGGIYTISTGFGVNFGEHVGAGIVMNSLIGERNSTFKQSFNGSTVFENSFSSEFSGRSWMFGMKFSTLYEDEREDPQDYIEASGWEVGITALIPEWRKATITEDGIITDLYLNDPSQVRLGVAAYADGNIFSVDGMYSNYNKVTDTEFVNDSLGTNIGFAPGVEKAFIAIGYEAYGIWRAGFHYRSYTITDSENSQVWTPALSTGVTMKDYDNIFSFDIGAEFEFFNWKEVLTYNNNETLNYSGVTFRLFATARLYLY
jgi:hypothetical protein